MIGTKGNLRRFNDVKVMIQNMKLERVSQCKYLFSTSHFLRCE